MAGQGWARLGETRRGKEGARCESLDAHGTRQGSAWQGTVWRGKGEARAASAAIAHHEVTLAVGIKKRKEKQ